MAPLLGESSHQRGLNWTQTPSCVSDCFYPGQWFTPDPTPGSAAADKVSALARFQQQRGPFWKFFHLVALTAAALPPDSLNTDELPSALVAINFQAPRLVYPPVSAVKPS